MTTMPDPVCSECGSRVTATASEGLCPACLIGGVLARGGMEEEPDCGPSVPRRAGEYELVSEIARGGMGVVYRARQAGLSREVAVKMIASADLAGPDEVRRFRVEAEAAAKLDHPNIIPVLGIGTEGGRPYFVMKLAEGGTLAQARVPMENRAAAEMMEKIARALQYAHERGVMHRDLKPANILLGSEGEPLVADFGLAKLAESGQHTMTGATLGTPGYMAPEQARGDTDRVTTASDVYGLGALLYFLLTGRAPFTGGSSMDVLRRLEAEEPDRPRALNPEADRDLEVIALKCLEKAPEKRIASARELAEELGRWLRGESIQSRPARWDERCVKWAKRRPVVASSLGLGLAALGLIFGLVVAGEFAIRQEKNAAVNSEAKAVAEAARARASERITRLNLYAADMLVIHKALDEGNLGVIRKALERHVPQAGQEDLRGFEWRWLQRFCRGNGTTVLKGHERAVAAVAFSPDGQTLASGGRDGRILLWSAAGGTLSRSLPPPGLPDQAVDLPAFLECVTRSPEAAKLIRQNLRQTDILRTGWRPSEIGEVSALAWSPDGKFLVSASVQSLVRVWRVSDLRLEWILPWKDVAQVAFSPDGRRLVLTRRRRGTYDAELIVVDAESREQLVATGQVKPPFAITRDGSGIVVIAANGRAEVHEMDTGRVTASWPVDSNPIQMVLSPNGRSLATLDDGGEEVGLWALHGGARLMRHRATNERLRAMEFAGDGMLMLTGTSQKVWGLNLASREVDRRLWGHENEIICLAVSPDGQRIASAGTDLTVRLWNISDGGNGAERLAETGAVVAISQDGGQLLAQAGDRTRCWNVAEARNWEVPGDLPRHGLDFTRDARGFHTVRRAGDQTLVETWTPGATTEPAVVVMQDLSPAWQECAACGATGVVAFTLLSGKIHMNSLETGRQLRVLEAPKNATGRVQLSRDGRWLSVFAWPRTLRLYDLATDAPPRAWEACNGTLSRHVFSPDGRMIATGSDDNMVRVWDTAAGTLLAELRGHRAEVTALAFSADSRTLASAGADLTLRLWNVPTWRDLGVYWRGEYFSWIGFSRSALFVHQEQGRGLSMLRADDGR